MAKPKVEGFEESTVSVGFSDSFLLVASIAGFCILAVSVYSLIMTRLKGSDELEEEELTHEEKLAKADVSSLTRAERRARARAIMKQQRRAAAAATPAGPADAADEDENQEEPEDENDQHQQQQHHHPHQPVLSRKERQLAAKAAEKEERRLYQDERKKQQQQAQNEAKRLKEERIAAEARKSQEEKRKIEMEKLQREEAEKEAWTMFLPAHECSRSQSVEDFVAELQRNRTVNLDKMATELGARPEVVQERIKQLIQEGRVAGFFQENNRFVFVSDKELDAIAASVSDKGLVTLKDVADICTNLIGAS